MSDPKVLSPVEYRDAVAEAELWTQRYNDALTDIQDEAFAARRKFAPFNSSHEGYAVIAEELDELWDDVKANNIDHAIEEAIQVGAMALRFIADMRAKYDL
jgi:hypothetical protein